MALLSLYSFIVSRPSRSRSWPYFFCSSRTWGCSSCIEREDLICLTNSGISAVRMITVSITMASVQVQPESEPKIGANRLWASTRMPETTQ